MPPLSFASRGSGSPTRTAPVVRPRCGGDDFHEPSRPRQSIIAGQPLPPRCLRTVPTAEDFYAFVRYVRKEAELNDGCAIVSLVFLDRMFAACDMQLTPDTWRPLLLTALLLASKTFDDLSMVNTDFEVFTPYSLRQINRWERKFLEGISYRLRVSGSTYALYYFYLREVAEAVMHQVLTPLEPLDAQRAQQLKLLSPDTDARVRAVARQRSQSFGDAEQELTIRGAARRKKRRRMARGRSYASLRALQ